MTREDAKLLAESLRGQLDEPGENVLVTRAQAGMVLEAMEFITRRRHNIAWVKPEGQPSYPRIEFEFED